MLWACGKKAGEREEQQGEGESEIIEVLKKMEQIVRKHNVWRLQISNGKIDLFAWL
jgi:hypothetical protein